MARLTQDQVVSGLVARGVPAHVAQGVAMNFRDESGFDTGIQERAPIAGRGGFGLAQWTGPRRAALEQFAAQQGKDISDPDLQLDYFMHENAGPEKAAWQKVVGASTPQEAATRFVNEWERPAPEHAAARSAAYGGVAVGDPTTDRTRPWHGPAEGPDPWSAENRQKLAAMFAQQQQQPKSLTNQLGDALLGMKFPAAQLTGTNALRPAPEAARADAEAVAPVAPLGGDRRQALAQVMAQLNSGRLYG
jgi:hypothetical protein